MWYNTNTMKLRIALFTCLFTVSVFATEKPNVIFLLCDDLGYGDVGFAWQLKRPAGVVRIETPNIDKLAAEGTILTQHYCAAPVCAPSRASIMTGKLQLGANARGGEGCSLINNEFDRAITETKTLGTMMRAAGYDTYAVGKWGIGGGGEGGSDRISHPLAKGFNHYYGFLDHMAGHTYYHYESGNSTFTSRSPYMGIHEGERDKSIAEADQPTEEAFNSQYQVMTTVNATGRYSTDLFVARAKKYIEDQLNDVERKDNPFFMYFAINTVHSSEKLDDSVQDKSNLHVPGGEYVYSNNSDGSVKWPIPDEDISLRNKWIDPLYRDKGLTGPAQRYATAITRMDNALGDLVDFLKRKGIYEKTIIIFTSDNGPAAERGTDPLLFESYGPFDGMKREVYEGGERMPTFVCWPGHKRKDVDPTPSISADWLATLQKLANSEKPEMPIPVTSQIEVTYSGSASGTYANQLHGRKGSTNCGGNQWIKREGDIVSLKAGSSQLLRYYNVVTDPHQDKPIGEGSGAYAQVGSTTYDSLATAIENANGEVITILRDVPPAGIALNGEVKLSVPAGEHFTVLCDFSGSGSITKLGEGGLTLAGNSTFTGGVKVEAGTLRGDRATSFGAANGTADSPDVLVTGGELDLFAPAATYYVKLDGGAMMAHGTTKAKLEFEAGATLKPVEGEILFLDDGATITYPDSGKIVVDLGGRKFDKGDSVYFIGGENLTSADTEHFKVKGLGRGYYLELADDYFVLARKLSKAIKLIIR